MSSVEFEMSGRYLHRGERTGHRSSVKRWKNAHHAGGIDGGTGARGFDDQDAPRIVLVFEAPGADVFAI
jgi:hypothetical protein